MTEIFRSWRDFLRADFRPGLYGLTALVLVISIVLNYAFDFEDSVIDSYRMTPGRMPAYFALYALGYYPTAWLWCRVHGHPERFRRRDFWLFSAFGLLVLALWRDFFFYQYLAEVPPFRQVYTLAFRCLSNLSSVLTVFLPFGIFYATVAQPRTYFYGFKPYRPALGVYLGLLAVMVPPIAWASFQPDFLETYPTFKDWDAFAVLGTPAWVPPLVYELCYGFDFISTELIFRGFLVVGMAHLLGRGTVLPMVVVYAFLHFGKPLGECVGSVFGGYLLGILALHSRSLWGGVVLHLGVAWLMEAAAFLQLKWSGEL
jgi:hypothetical protein